MGCRLVIEGFCEKKYNLKNGKWKMLFDLKVWYCIILYYMLYDEFVLFYKNGYDNIDIINNIFIKL